MPIPVSRLAGSDTIEDIFKLSKRSKSKEPDIDVDPEPPAPPLATATQKFEDVPLATPHRHSTHLHFRKPQISTLGSESVDLSTPLLVSSSASPSACTPGSTLGTPRMPVPNPHTLDAQKHKSRRALDVIVNRSPSTSGFAELEVDNKRYLRAALGLDYPDPEGWGELRCWSEAYTDGAYVGDGGLDAWYMGENEPHGWAFPEVGY